MAFHIGTDTFDTIRSTNLDGLDPKILIENCNVFTIDDDWFIIVHVKRLNTIRVNIDCL